MKKLEVDMTSGAIFKKIVAFAIPLIFTNLLQILFNACDVLILGIFVNDNAVAAVGATSALINLIVGLFVGLSVGANVMVSAYLGKRDEEKVKRTVGMSVLLSVIVGVLLIFVGVFGARLFLTWMSCAPAVIDMAETYLKIYFIGMPVMMLYNFCAAILRAAGETVKPLVFLTVGGIVNVLLNIFFVTVLRKNVEGVAIATVVSQAISAACCIYILLKSKGVLKLELKHLRIYKSELWEMVKIGVPSGLQGCLFSVSNVVVQSGVNSFGEVVMAGNSYAQQIEAVVYQSMNGVSLAALSFVGQNYGAGKYDRIKKIVWECTLLVTIVGVVLGGLAALLAKELVGLIASDPAVTEVAARRMVIVCLPYALCGIMEVYSFALRGFGKSTSSMLINLFCTCVFRIVWISVMLKIIDEIYVVYWAYPISWFLAAACMMVYYFITLNKLIKKSEREKEEELPGVI